MRTLFVRVLLWYLALLVLTTAGFLVLNTLRGPRVPSEGLDAGDRVRILDAVVQIHEAEGSAGVIRYLREVESEFDIRAVATDRTGRNLADDSDWSALVQNAAARIGPYVYDDAGFFLATTDATGNWIFFEVPQALVFFSAQNLWMFGVAFVLCYILARHLTSPLKSLRGAVERFGSGDLSARLNTRRRDELGQLAKTFDGMADRIESLVENQQTLLGDISHELRSPLTRLRLAVDLGRSGGDQNEAYNRIEKEVARLDALVEELLSWTKYDSGALEPGRSDVWLDEMLEYLVSLHQLEAEEKGCRIELETERPVVVYGSEEALRRAIENVLNNAIRFAPSSSAVTVWLEQTGEEIQIRFRDRGPGVPADLLPRIFEAFLRVDPDRSRDTGGAGLGLAIAAKAVEAHDGTIAARNMNPGLEIAIRLPRSPNQVRTDKPAETGVRTEVMRTVSDE